VDEPEEITAFTDIFDRHSDDESNEDDDAVARPPTPNTFDELPPLSSQPHRSVPATQEPSGSGVAKKKSNLLSNTDPAVRQKKNSSTPYARAVNARQELDLDSSSDDEAAPT
ncbi:hypothetical protein DFH28DRAFT_863644, partial [Melampsora americana]